MKRFLLFAIIIGIVVVVQPRTGRAADAAGTVTRVKGSVSAAAGGNVRLLAVGGPVYVGDYIASADDGRLEIRMRDGAVITLGGDSVFLVDAFEPERRGVVGQLFYGVFLGVSGSRPDGKAAPMTIETAIATIGIRGTTFWGSQQPKRLEVALIEGSGVYVAAAGREVVLTTPAYGTSVEIGQAPAEPKPWAPERLAAAKRTVSFD